VTKRNHSGIPHGGLVASCFYAVSPMQTPMVIEICPVVVDVSIVRGDPVSPPCVPCGMLDATYIIQK
jgi:hypothetical protein